MPELETAILSVRNNKKNQTIYYHQVKWIGIMYEQESKHMFDVSNSYALSCRSQYHFFHLNKSRAIYDSQSKIAPTVTNTTFFE